MENNKRLVKSMPGTKVYTELTRPEDELMMIREMLKSNYTVPTQNGSVYQMSDYVGEKRQFLTQRLYDLIYSTEVEKEEEKGNEISEKEMISKSVKRKS